MTPRQLLQQSRFLIGKQWVFTGLFFAILLPLTLAPRIGRRVPVPTAGVIATEDITAPVSLERVDEEATRDLRVAARAAIPPVFDYDTEAAAPALAFLGDLFERARRGESGGPIPAPVRTALKTAGVGPACELRLRAAVSASFELPIAAGRSLLPENGPLTLREVPSGRERKAATPLQALTPEEARSAALRSLAAQGGTPAERRLLDLLLPDLIVPSLTYNAALTEARRRESAARVEPLIVRVPAGRTVVRSGDIVSTDAVRTLEALNRARADRISFPAVLGHLLFLGLVLFFIHRYVFVYQRADRRRHDLFVLTIVVLVLSICLDCGFLWLFDQVAGGFNAPPFDDPSIYRYMTPVATGAVLTTLLLNPRAGMALVLFCVPLLGLLTGWDLRALLFGLMSNLAGICSITAYRRRLVLVRAGILLGAMNAAAVLALAAIGSGVHTASGLVFQVFCGFASGILVSILVSFLLPLFESAFNILTQVRLLELSNLENPLLRRLAMESPGSYHHSVIVGTLAEAAAEAVGANALFCRVAAYYHDVGKMLKPTYFVENQREGENRHDRLRPHLSAKVIASHVREGMELARAHGVPQEILDIIPQHHGTRRINYFYQKARRQGAPQGEDVREADFRYPGPRPQSREAAILMVADSIEAAARSLDEPTPARLKGVVNTIVSDVVVDDQFSECDLTFSDLERARAAFFKTLCSIHHHRIDYPGFDFDAVEERPFKASPTHDDAPVDAAS